MKNIAGKVKDWLDEIRLAKKREKDYLKDGKLILDIYSGKKDVPFNILYSNTEVLLPALFSQQPRPVVKKRWRDEDELSRAASLASERCLEYLIDTNFDGYEKFSEAVQSAVLDGLLAGRGVTSIKYDAVVEEIEDRASEVESNKESEDDEISEEVKWESVFASSRKWDRVYFGYATKWVNVPWVAYEEWIDEEEAERLFGEEIKKKIQFSEKEDGDEEGQGERKTALVYQIWDKSEKKVIWISEQYPEDYLKEDDDPLEVTGFFNCPRPLQFVEKPSDLAPTPVYKLYENQAQELNEITRRLSRVIKAIRARGIYDGQLGDDLENIMDVDDAVLTPAEAGSSLSNGGFDKAIWFLPIEKLIATAQQLYQARESAKRVIYEITGISDIVRGQSMASETLGAQKIKEQWGTMRLKRLQKRVQEYSRDVLRIMLDVAIKKFSEDTWVKITGLSFLTEENAASMDSIIEAAKQSGQEPPPEVQKYMNTPRWKDILELLRDDFARSYKVDIETNSTLDVEATEDKQLVSEFMNAMAQFMNGIMPMVQSGTMPWQAAQSMMLQISRRFRFGEEVESQLKMMKPPQQQNPEQIKKRMEGMKKGIEQEKQKIMQEKQKLQVEKEKFKSEQDRYGKELDEQFFQLGKERMQFDFDKRLFEEQQKLKAESEKLGLKYEAKEAQLSVKSMTKDMERKMQSMMDKHTCHIKDMITAVKEI